MTEYLATGNRLMKDQTEKNFFECFKKMSVKS